MSKQRGIQARWKRLFCACLLYGTTAMLLQACLPTAIVGTGVAGTIAATDRRTIGTQAEDRTISFKSESIADAIAGNQGHINVTSFNRLALITGEVANEGLKTRVASEVAQVQNVKRVVNELEIAAPSSLGSRSSDSLITAKVVASFVDAEGLYANSLKTVTERGVVYLMGRVTEREGTRAAEVASMVPGVQRVVMVFEHISEEELRRMESQTAEEGATTFKDGDEYR